MSEAAWLCSCGSVSEDGYHCESCGDEGPWGCPCEECETRGLDEGSDDDQWPYEPGVLEVRGDGVALHAQ